MAITLVAEWADPPDGRGSGYSWPANVGGQPLTKDNGANNPLAERGVLFVPENCTLSCTNWSTNISIAFTIAINITVLDVASMPSYLWANSGSNVHGYCEAGADKLCDPYFLGSAGISDTDAFQIGVAARLVYVANDPNSKIYLNNAEIATGNVGVPTFGQRLTINGLVGSGISSANIKVRRIRVYDGAASVGEVAEIDSWLDVPDKPQRLADGYPLTRIASDGLEEHLDSLLDARNWY